MLPTAAAFLAGAAGEFFLDPQNGKRRRHMLRDRGLAMVRRPARRGAWEAERRTSYAEGVVRGAVHEAMADGDRDPNRLNDAGLAAKIQSEAFRGADAPKARVSLNVENGVVYLRGELNTADEVQALVDDVSSVDGVSEIRNLLHLRDEPAPMNS